MMIGNNDINTANVNQNAVVEKVSPVKNVSSVNESVRDNNLSTESQQTPDTKKLDEAVQKINEHIQVVQHELHFSVDEDSGQTVIKVMDLETNEVIRQIPNEEALNIARGLAEGVDLKLINEYI